MYNQINEKYNKENDDLMKVFIEKEIFNKYASLQRGEFIVRSTCNQHCEYCYLRHEDLNPKDADKETILRNLDAMLDYIYFEKKTIIKRWDLFAGDMFFDGLIYDIYEHFDKFFDKLREKDPSLFYEPMMLSMPCNCSFLEDDEHIKKMRYWINHFKAKDVIIHISWSTDGPYAVDVREQRELKNDYFTKGFEFLKEFGFGAHPMVAACSIDNAIKNYDWWLEQYKKYEISDAAKVGDFQPMFLEVRNNDWTPKTIKTYLEFLRHVIEKRLEICNNDFDNFVFTVFCRTNNSKDREKGNYKIKPLQNYDPIGVRLQDKPYCYQISCSEQDFFHIRLTDLALVPCHRLSYPQFVGGNFILDENGKVCDFKSHNPALYLATKNLNTQYYPRCYNCPLNKVCPKGCLGSQFETYGELFMPIDCVCDLFLNKYYYLLSTYEEMGALDRALELNFISEKTYNIYKEILNALKERGV